MKHWLTIHGITHVGEPWRDFAYASCLCGWCSPYFQDDSEELRRDMAKAAADEHERQVGLVAEQQPEGDEQQA
jgi:hypothetical protein